MLYMYVCVVRICVCVCIYVSYVCVQVTHGTTDMYVTYVNMRHVCILCTYVVVCVMDVRMHVMRVMCNACFVCMYVRMYLYVCTCLWHVCMYVCMSACVHVCMYCFQDMCGMHVMDVLHMCYVCT